MKREAKWRHDEWKLGERDQRKRKTTEKMNDVVVIRVNWYMIMRGVTASSVKASPLLSSVMGFR